jgi:hypothetical protein
VKKVRVQTERKGLGAKSIKEIVYVAVKCGKSRGKTGKTGKTGRTTFGRLS